MDAFYQQAYTMISSEQVRNAFDLSQESDETKKAYEFGRSPKINASAGRDHFARVFATGLAGGGLKRGYVHGESDATSSEVKEDDLPLPDFHASIYHLMGINAEDRLMAPGGRPVPIIDGGKIEKKLFA